MTLRVNAVVGTCVCGLGEDIGVLAVCVGKGMSKQKQTKKYYHY